ncbi:MAG: hypothetical protein ACF8TS_05830 [Maioricimonas sp. JB049]
MIQGTESSQDNRRERVKVSMTREEKLALRDYAARCRMPMADVLAELAGPGLQAVLAGGDPLKAARR